MRMRRVYLVGVALLAAIFLTGQAWAKPIEIQWWHAMRSARGEVVKSMVEKFNQSQDKYKVIEVNKGNYDETVNAGIAAIRAKKHPHILQSFEVGTQTMMLSGAIYPVYQLMKDFGYKVDWSDYLQPVLSYYMDADGNLMSMPFNSSTPIIYYNVELFEKAGLPPLPRDKPVTWDEMGEMLAKIVASGVPGGMVAAWQSWTQIENYSAMHNIPFASRANGYKGLDCELLINNDKVISHITRLKKWLGDKRFMYGGQKYQGPKAEFLAQNAAVYFDSISGIAKIQKAATFKWDAAPMPVEAWMTNPQNSIIGGASNWVLKGHKKEEYAGVAAFLEFLATPEMQEFWHMQTGYFPITKSAYRSLKAKGYYDKYPYQEVGIKQMTRRDPTEISRGLRLGYFIQIRNIINEELELVWNGTKTPKEAMDSAVKRGNEQLRQFEKIYK